MFVTIRCSNAPLKRFRLETHAEASLLELCCQTAEQLGALCPPTGFQLSMNKQDALGGGNCYLTSLKDLGVRHADVLYVLDDFANPCALFAAVHRVLDLTKPPATGSVTTQTVSQGVCNGTQTPGRPFPSDTGTQTDFQVNDPEYGVSADLEEGHRCSGKSFGGPTSGNKSRETRALDHVENGAQWKDKQQSQLLDCYGTSPVILPTPLKSCPIATHANGQSCTQSPVLSTCPAFNTDAQTERSEEPSLFLQHSGPPCGQIPDSDSDASGYENSAEGARPTAPYEDLDRDADRSDDDYDGSSLGSSDIDGGTTFLPSTQTPSSQQPPADTKRCTMTPPLSLSHDCGDNRKRLRSNQCHTER